MRYCVHCGHALEENSTTCSNCGAGVMVMTPELPEQNNSYDQYSQQTEQQNGYQQQGYNQNNYQQNYQQQGYPNPYGYVEQKSKVAAGILGILLGMFGVHNFYLGYIGKGIAQLLITLLSFFILSPISGIWGLIEGILILTGSIHSDAKGIPLKD